MIGTGLGALSITLLADIAGLQRDMDRARREVEGTMGGIARAGDLARTALGWLGAGFSVAGTIRKLVEVQREFDVLNSSLVTVTGGSVQAEAAFAWIKEFAATTPYSLSEVTRAFTTMKALGLDASMEALTSYGNTASAMGKNLDQMIQAVADAATGEFERLKEFGIKARSQGEQVSLTFQGVTTTIGKNSDEISDYLRKIGDVEFAGAMAERAKTLDGQLSNLGDTWDELFRTVNKANTGGFIADSVQVATASIGELIRIINELSATTENGAQRSSGFKTVMDGISTVFEAVAVTGANVSFVFRVLANDAVSSLTAMGYSATLQLGMAKKTMDMAAAYAASERKNLDDLEARLLGLAATTETVFEAVSAAEAEAAAEAARVAGERKKQAKDEAARRDAAAKAKQEAAALDKLLADTDLARHKALVEQYALLDRARRAGKIGVEQYAQAMMALKKSVTGYTDAEWEQVEANHEVARSALVDAENAEYRVAAYEKSIAATDAYIDKLWAEEMAKSDSIEAAEKLVKEMEQEVELLGLSDAARTKVIALRQLEAAGINLSAEKLEEYRARLAAALDEKARISDMNEEIGRQAGIWQSIEQTAHDTFVNVLSGGKDLWTRLKETGQNIFFDWLYQMTAKKWLTNVSASVSGSSVAGQAFGAGNVPGGMAGGGFGIDTLLGAVTGFGESVGMFVGGVAEMAGVGSAMAGSIGAMVATALPWVAAIAGIVALVDAFGTGGTPHLGSTREFDLSGENRTIGLTEGRATGRPGWLFGSSMEPGQRSPYDDALQAAGATLTQKITANMAALGGTIDDSIRFALGFAAENEAETQSGGFARVMIGDTSALDLYKRYAADGKAGLEAFLKEVMPKVELISYQVAEGLHPAIDAVADSIDVSTASLEAVNAALKAIGEWGPVLTTLQTYLDADLLGDATEQIRLAGRTAYQVFTEAGTSLATLAADFDGSLASAQALGQATQAQYQMELQLIGQIQGLLQSTHSMFGSSIRDIQMSVLDNEGQYNFLDAELTSLVAQLATAIDPAVIGNLANQIDQLTGQAWGLLDDSQRQVRDDEFIARLTEADQLAAERLNAAQTAVQDQHNRTVAAIGDKMDAAAAAFMAAAQAQQTAADTPVRVDNRISVNVDVDMPANVEVGYG